MNIMFREVLVVVIRRLVSLNHTTATADRMSTLNASSTATLAPYATILDDLTIRLSTTLSMLEMVSSVALYMVLAALSS